MPTPPLYHRLESLRIPFTPNPRLPDVGEYALRSVAAEVHPQSRKQVLDVLNLAKEYSLPLCPVSRGRNWGLGSKKPAAGGCLLLDLSGLNRIKKLDLLGGFAIVEPGVTQQQLARRLSGTPFMLNVTGAAGHTSIVGNALERGVGFLRQRTEDVAGLELLLGDGRILKVGSFWQTGNPQFHYPPGSGPDLRGLFQQSGFAVVLSAAIALIPRPEYSCLALFEVEKNRRAVVTGILKDLFVNRFFSCVVKLREQPGSYLGIAALSGKREMVRAQKELLSGMLPEGTCLRFLDEQSRDMTPGEKVFLDAFNGMPGAGPAGSFPANPDESSLIGYRLLLPILPFDTGALEEMLDFLDGLPLSPHLALEKTVNLLSAGAVDLVLYLNFMRNEEGIARAEKMQKTILAHCQKKGYFPYRYDIDHQDGQSLYNKDYRAFLEEIKQCFDPGSVISPGRYL